MRSMEREAPILKRLCDIGEEASSILDIPINHFEAGIFQDMAPTHVCEAEVVAWIAVKREQERRLDEERSAGAQRPMDIIDALPVVVGVFEQRETPYQAQCLVGEGQAGGVGDQSRPVVVVEIYAQVIVCSCFITDQGLGVGRTTSQVNDRDPDRLWA